MALAHRSVADSKALETYVDRFSPLLNAWLAVVVEAGEADKRSPQHAPGRNDQKDKDHESEAEVAADTFWNAGEGI